MEKRILSFQLGALHNMENINNILGDCYRETGQKFSINFNGSKGYLDHIEITSEGDNLSHNKIEYAMLVQTPNYNTIGITIYHSKEKGVRIEIENIEEIKTNFFKSLNRFNK
jgi:hypothetical protein